MNDRGAVHRWRAWGCGLGAGLEDRPALYMTFRDKKEGCIKVVPRPND